MKLRFPFIFSAILVLSLSACTPPPGSGGKDGAAGGMGGTIQFIFLGMMILVFWLFFIRPQAKRAKNQKLFIENLGKGEKVVTISGIHGTINKINEDGTLMIEVSPGSYLKMEKSAISMEMTAALNKPAVADKK
jgi:preprotein translocase subunit YajC